MNTWKLPLGMAILAISVGAHAVEPMGIELDSGIKLLPALTLSVEDNDNAYLQPEATKEGTTITRLAPSLSGQADLGQTLLYAGFAAEKGMYSSDENDNYTDSRINVGGDFELTSRHQVNLRADMNSLHDARGSGTVEGAAALGLKYPDEYDETVMDGRFVYGSESAFANIIGIVNRYEKEYQNNFEAGTRDRDHTKTMFGAQAALDVSSASDLLIDVSTTSIDYSNDSDAAESREGNLLKALVGANWDITGKTSGAVKVGASKRSFDQDDVDADTRFSWEASLTWNPRSYSTVTLFSSQSANETSGPGNYIDSNFSSASWEHKFSQYFALTADVSLAKDEYYNDVDNREDETLSYGLKGVYSPGKAVDVFGSVKQAERDSTTDGLDYENQIVTVGLALAI